jgi:hypothetical protein
VIISPPLTGVTVSPQFHSTEIIMAFYVVSRPELAA